MSVDSTQNIMTYCCHGELYQECVFGCKLWQYTRTGRKHYIDTEDCQCFDDGPYWNLWVIADTCGCFRGIAGSEGYDLYHKGKLIRHGKTVKELKTAALAWKTLTGMIK